MGEKTRKACTGCLGLFFPCAFLLGALCIAGGLVFYLKYPSLVTSQVNEKVTLEPGHASYEQLQNPTIKIYKKFYFFNWTNYQEFVDKKGKATPVLEEKGPYSYIESRTKTFTKSDNKDELNYNQTKIFFFDPKTSGANLSDSDIIYTVNIPLIAAIGKIKGSKLHTFFEGYLHATDVKVYVRQSVKSLLWGYSDPLIRFLNKHHKLPVSSIAIQVNNSIDDQKTSTINTGASNISLVGQFSRWNGNHTLDRWFSPEANQIDGTEGFFFKPHLEMTDKLTAFVDDTMRSFDLVFQRKVDHLGIEAFRYRLDNATFKSAFSEPRNGQFGSWCPDGLIFLGPTQVVRETPVFGSKPHFLDADPQVRASVSGLTPDRDKHDTIIDLEPTTGADIYFHRQLQLNVQVNRTDNWWFYKHLNDVSGYNGSGVLYMPVLYIDETAEIDQDFKDYLERKGLHLVSLIEILAPVIFGVLIFIGTVFLLLGILTCVCWCRRVRPKKREYPQMVDYSRM